MRNKAALVIIYTGEPASLSEQRAVVEFFAKHCNAITHAEDVDVYSIDASDIARGVVIKATQEQPEQENIIDSAAAFIGDNFKDSISAGIPTFAANISTTYVSIKLRGACNLSGKEAMLIKSVELLAQDGAYDAISSKIRRKYHITLGIINVIKDIYDSVCQGQLIGW